MSETAPWDEAGARALLTAYREAERRVGELTESSTGQECSDANLGLVVAYRDLHERAEADLEHALAELTRLREAQRWRTVATDGLPAAGERVLVAERGDAAEVYMTWLDDQGGWYEYGDSDPVHPADRWLPVPGESE